MAHHLALLLIVIASCHCMGFVNCEFNFTLDSLRTYQALRRGDLSPAIAADAAVEFWEIVGPGGKLHPAWFLEHKGHLVIEGVLICVIMYMLLQHSFKPKQLPEEALSPGVRSQRAPCGRCCRQAFIEWLPLTNGFFILTC